MKRRVIVMKNGCTSGAKVVELEDSLCLLLSAASSALAVDGARIFNDVGAEVRDIGLVRDGDTLYISEGEDFSSSDSPRSDWVTLNVGGRLFATTRMTLIKEPQSMLARMFCSSMTSSTDRDGAYLVDRSPKYFEPILNYLRHGKLILERGLNPRGVLEEAQFYGIESIVPHLERLTDNCEDEDDGTRREHRCRPLTRSDVVDVLVRTSPETELRFQGVDLTAADLSKLDLRRINFKYACMKRCNLSGANLSWCNLERADLSSCKMDGAQLLGVRMLCASLEGSSLRGCNFEDPAGSRANMEGVNMKAAVLEESNMAGVNLRVATLKNANLQNCILRGAVLAGADLEGCDLTGSDLQKANLRGANLKDTTLELMLNPLHMSQAIR